MNSPTPLLRRPNGRPQACEPCRKRKVACDHTQPVCNRCRKKRQAGDCVYLASESRALHAARRLQPPSPLSSASPAVPHSISPDVSETPPDNRGNDRQMGSGYLGFTSFSAVFEETQISLSSVRSSLATPPESSEYSQENPTPDQFTLSPRTREACLFVLKNVPNPSRGKICLRSSPAEAWYYYFLDRVLNSFYEAFGHYFGPQKSDKSLEELATIISKNTTTLPLSDDDDITAYQWIAQFSGSRTRWETLGLLFGFWDFEVNSITIEKSLTQDEYGRPSPVTKKCVDFCVALCHECSTPTNSMLLFVTYRRLIMETIIFGDMSRRSWLFLGEVVALLTFLGYHALPDAPDYQPSFMTEIKRRLYYQIYNTHMVMVSLTGRPPLMSRTYDTTPLPLDIGNSTLYSENEDALIKVADSINHTGWNKDERRFSVTFMRVRAQLAMLREEIMDIALNTRRHTTVEELLALKARESSTVAGFPSFIRYNDSDLEDQRNDVYLLYWKLLMRLDHLLNVFFLERLLLKHGHTQSELLSVSFEMITYTLPFWTHQDTLLPLRGDCEWLIMAYGVPAGGILCQELLRPTLHNDPRITRSSLIQKLSLLVGFLDWIKPTAPNGDLCSKCKSIIKHVLDQALNAPAPAPGFEAAFDWDFTTQVDFDFDLLDTFGWTRADFSLSQQTNA
ncbi:hypothetical protein F4808DRAFT_420255 [Astrocystis sublimbata]|nr:hypothetical protein F4808DRAFT_420255 [Astrocystis sublimbata]